MKELTNEELKDVTSTTRDGFESQQGIESSEVLVSVRNVPLKVDEEAYTCASCIFEEIQCGPHHQVN